ncbi:MAG TPA: cytochrome c [Candidatus Acidoferrales bacterium]|nr:cytochrome c [Candidatus Acidoferrales bacterium]
MSKHKVTLLFFMGLAIAAACPSASWAGTAQEAQKIFVDKCARCHAENGSGDTPVGKALGAADLRSPTVQKLTDAEIYAQIDKGKANMPPFGSGLNKAQINDLIAYVRALAKKQVAAKK